MEDVAFLPFLQFSECELVAVYLTQQLGVFENTPFKPKLKSAFRKLLGLFCQKENLSFDPELLDECFSFDAAGPHARFRPAHLDQCARAMLRQEELLLTYVKQHGEGAGVPGAARPAAAYYVSGFRVLCGVPGSETAGWSAAVVHGDADGEGGGNRGAV
jgi:hypothetical protein